jgi:hypothetical protein
MRWIRTDHLTSARSPLVQSTRAVQIQQPHIRTGPQYYTPPIYQRTPMHSQNKHTGGFQQSILRTMGTMVHSCSPLLLIPPFTRPAGRRVSKRITKGKAPARPDSAMDVDEPQRGRKTSTVGHTAQEHAVEADADISEGEPTPRKVQTPVARPALQVVVHSPPSARPTQRLRINEEGDAVELPSPPVAASPKLWVGRGEVCHI